MSDEAQMETIGPPRVTLTAVVNSDYQHGMMRWKPVVNAFAITFSDRWPGAETY